MSQAGTRDHSPPVPRKDLRTAIRISAVISLLAAIVLVSYAWLAGTGVNPYFADEVRRQMVMAAVVVSISLFPTALFAIRYYSYRKQGGLAPSTPLSLLAALSVIPFALGLALLFAV